eukprot:CAMPEP_0175899180 /NCGR_PEP_ID=MMETSP0108-20121206/1651_1 /TAXON_ID=195067 ORGANISM="Goniomonas pacifica, Strain CCMP1869" /NCGR_SAMPLE_ID=MMETSP0108 /ASSEMBLY_ACC=CAM_ASM_000204 /LENGTH=119 /DNA_ID=CAMNT_0017220599 /DNA_START=107 /DNA_END=467 /DNA_ORIENTATION=-
MLQNTCCAFRGSFICIGGLRHRRQSRRPLPHQHVRVQRPCCKPHWRGRGKLQAYHFRVAEEHLGLTETLLKVEGEEVDDLSQLTATDVPQGAQSRESGTPLMANSAMLDMFLMSPSGGA